MLLYCFLLLLVSSVIQAYIIVTPIVESAFQERYLLQDQTSMTTNLLIISCKQYQVLSVKILPKDGSQQDLPNYKIFRQEDKQSYTQKSYTFLKNCHVDIDVKSKDSLVIIKRKNSPDHLFQIKKVSFQKGNNTFQTNDASQIFGLGQRFQQHFDMRDGTWAIWNRDRPWEIDQGLPTKATQTYGFQPIYLAREHNSKLFHITFFQTVHAMNVIKSGSKITYRIVDGNAHFLIFVGGNNPQSLLQKYHRFIGPSLIPPFWSLGYHQCRWQYTNVNALEHVIQMHDKHEVPIDVLWNDLDYMQLKRDFTVDQVNFPLTRMKNNILSKVHYVPLIDAGIAIQQQQAYKRGDEMNAFIKLNGKNYIGKVWPGLTSFVDFLHPNGSKYWNMMFDELYEKIPFSGVWIDMNEIADFNGNAPTYEFETYKVQHNEQLSMMTIDLRSAHFNSKNFVQPLNHREVHAYYGHLMAESTNTFLQSKGKRPFIISRSNAVGTGVYAGHWSGDNVATWNFLRLSINGNFLFQIFGIHMVGADICGFHLDTTQELCSRWMQLGAFYPFMRNHNEKQFKAQQVYALGQDHLKTSKLSLDLRYSLLKQYYSAFVKTKGTGSLYRPLIFQFPNDQTCYEIDVLQQQFMIGDFLMGTPIVSPQTSSKLAYFPQGWFDYFDGSYKTKRQTITNTLPSAPSIFIRQGKIIFVSQPKLRTKYLDSNFTIKIGLKPQNSHLLAQGYIMSITDYQNNTSIEQCIKLGCFYKIKALMTTQQQLQLSWIYSGAPNLNQKISINNIQIYQQGKQVIKKSIQISLQKESNITVTLS